MDVVALLVLAVVGLLIECHGHSVVAVLVRNRVLAGVAVKVVGSPTAVEHIVSIATVQLIIAGAALDDVAAVRSHRGATAVEHVVAASALESVDAGAAD